MRGIACAGTGNIRRTRCRGHRAGHLTAQNDRLRHLLLKLTRMQFGARSERLPEEQLQLGLEALEQAIAKDEAEAEKQDPELRKGNAAKRRASRGALPAHLPRIEVIAGARGHRVSRAAGRR